MAVPESAARCIDVDRRLTIVLLNYPNKAYLTGIVNVKAIRGTIQILGYDLTPDRPSVPVYSIKEFSTLKVDPVNDAKFENDATYLESSNVPRSKIDQIMAEATCYSHIFVVSKNEDADSFASYLRTFDFLPIAKTNENDQMVRLSKVNGENILTESSEWDDLAQKLLLRPRKAILCGGKSVGKSTLLRYLVNRLLSQWTKVLVLDFDPGQSEFTVMGCLSAVLVERPLLGPNFSHIQTPERCTYLGDTSVSDCYGLFSEGVERLVEFCDRFEYEEVPWIVNTMGFVKGLGIALLAEVMEAVKPSDIVQIVSEKDKHNFPSDLTPEFLSLQNPKLGADNRWKPRLHLLSSVAEKNDAVFSASIRDAAIKRNIVTMSYFRSAMESVNDDLLSTIPREIKINDVQIVIAKPTSKEIEMTMTVAQKLCCINANMVALCSGENPNQLNCLGFGIVRGFDIETDLIYLITPLGKEALKKVTVIKMSSSVQLPFIVFKNHANQINGSYPYVSDKMADRLSQPIRKTSSRMKYTQDT